MQVCLAPPQPQPPTPAPTNPNLQAPPCRQPSPNLTHQPHPGFNPNLTNPIGTTVPSRITSPSSPCASPRWACAPLGRAPTRRRGEVRRAHLRQAQGRHGYRKPPRKYPPPPCLCAQLRPGSPPRRPAPADIPPQLPRSAAAAAHGRGPLVRRSAPAGPSRGDSQGPRPCASHGRSVAGPA